MTINTGKAKAKKVTIAGRVQGIGFRPFIYRLAHSLGLKGWVRNTQTGVIIEIAGPEEKLQEFLERLSPQAPPLAHIERIETKEIIPASYQDFTIEVSRPEAGQIIQVQPDLTICDDCLREMKDPNDRRYNYPFLNCTNCGPRFTIIKSVPYDRKNTTMAPFKMCPDCHREYDDPRDRRYHAQPTACPRCGPSLTLLDASTHPLNTKDIIHTVQDQLLKGKTVAIKGLGGYHLACDGLNDQAVDRLRQRKYREDKPFAVMMPSLGVIKKYCYITKEEENLLCSYRRPIVLLRHRPDKKVASGIAPHNPYLGVMLPYTPLHHLLLKNQEGKNLEVLVMTSGNVSQEPIAFKDEETLQRLGNIADRFLIHNREIQRRCDDSVTRIFAGKETVLRRARGYAPIPLRLGFKVPEILAVGAELKNTFCFGKEEYAYLSHHLGDLENLETLEAFEQGIEDFKQLFSLRPRYVAYDLHPDYLSTKYALNQKDLQPIAVQHHHAHIASCMVENELNDRVIGVAFDGVGLGTDNTIWGGEFLIANFKEFQRFAYLQPVPLPGIERAIKEPWRMAAIYLEKTFGSEFLELPIEFCQTIDKAKWKPLSQSARRGFRSPLTSSMGRVFDAVSALLGIRQTINYEGQAAMELEYRASDSSYISSYPFKFEPANSGWQISVVPIFEAIVEDLKRKLAVEQIAGKFHQTIARLVWEGAAQARKETGLNRVVLSGGCFQNFLLLQLATDLLEDAGFEVYIHHQVPPNDGGISLGQLAIATCKLRHNQV